MEPVRRKLGREEAAARGAIKDGESAIKKIDVNLGIARLIVFLLSSSAVPVKGTRNKTCREQDIFGGFQDPTNNALLINNSRLSSNAEILSISTD